MKKYFYLLLLSSCGYGLLGNPTTDSLYQQAESYLDSGEYVEAIHVYQRLLPQYQQEGKVDDYINTHFNILLSQYYLANYEEMLEHVSVCLPEFTRLEGDNSKTLADLYLYEGLAYFELDNLHHSFISNKNAYGILLTQPISEELEQVVAELAYISKKRGDNFAAIEYYKESIRLKKMLGVENDILMEDIISLGGVYEITGEYLEALGAYLNALHLLESNKNEDVLNKARIYSGIGHLYSSMKLYDKATNWLQKSIMLVEKYHLAYDIPYNNLGMVLIEQERYGESIPYIVRSHRQRLQAARNKRSLAVGKTHASLGRAFIGLTAYDSAIWHLQESVKHFLPTFNPSSPYDHPSLDLTNSEDALMYPMARKGIAFVGKALDSGKEKDREAAIQSFKKAIALMKKMREQFEVEGSKRSLAHRTWWVFEAAIKGAMTLYEATGEKKYQVAALQFAEKSKVILMQDAWAESLAQENAGVPEELRKAEYSLKTKIAQLENKLYQAELRDQQEIANKTRHELLKKREELREMSAKLEKDYPHYYLAKYYEHTVGIEKIQQELKKGQAIVEYFMGEKECFIFLIARHQFMTYSFSVEKLGKLIPQFRKSIKTDLNVSDLERYDLFTQCAYQLQQLLMGQVLENLPDGVDKLIVIPDGSLHYVPFELLLKTPADEDQFDYRQLTYLITDYDISYAYSSSFARKAVPSGAAEQDVLAMAPNYSLGDAGKDSTRANLNPLIWNSQEVKQIKEYFSTNVLTDAEANETLFKELAGQYRIIHLAMHAFLDEENPMRSCLAFSTNSEQDDGLLNIYELYNMKLNADLAILSACNTGQGKYIRGEGVLSLGQAFAYAGCPSIVISQWAVDDQATARLMDVFYKQLAEGKSKSAALRAAKLAYLKSASPKESYPMYWGGFTLLGDDAPIAEKKTPFWMWLLPLFFLLALVLKRRFS